MAAPSLRLHGNSDARLPTIGNGIEATTAPIAYAQCLGLWESSSATTEKCWRWLSFILIAARQLQTCKAISAPCFFACVSFALSLAVLVFKSFAGALVSSSALNFGLPVRPSLLFFGYFCFPRRDRLFSSLPSRVRRTSPDLQYSLLYVDYQSCCLHSQVLQGTSLNANRCLNSNTLKIKKILTIFSGIL